MEFQHYIPKFILRRFCIAPDTINIYNNSMKVLTMGNILQTYGEYNMYNKRSPSPLLRHLSLEGRLSVLESRSAKYVKQCCMQNVIQFNKYELFDFVRFLYVMYYHTNVKREQYLNEQFDQTTLESMKKFMADHQLHTIKDLWSHHLNWFVTSSMDVITELLNSPYSNEDFINTVVHHTELTDFWNYYSSYQLSLWEAADETEFIITDTSFGCVEKKDNNHFFCFFPSFFNTNGVTYQCIFLRFYFKW